MSVTVLNRKLDKKRRLTIPLNAGNLKEGSKVVMVTSDDAVIITHDAGAAKEISGLLLRAETKHKLAALEEWQSLIEKAGLSNMSAAQIDRAVAKSLKRPKRLNA